MPPTTGFDLKFVNSTRPTYVELRVHNILLCKINRRKKYLISYAFNAIKMNIKMGSVNILSETVNII